MLFMTFMLRVLLIKTLENEKTAGPIMAVILKANGLLVSSEP